MKYQVNLLDRKEESGREVPYLLIVLSFVRNILEDIYYRASIPKTGVSIKIAENGPTIPYLMFADDFLIFFKTFKTVARKVKEIVRDYCKIYGQLENNHKSLVQFFKGIEKNFKVGITDILQIPSSNSIETYLGCKNID